MARLQQADGVSYFVEAHPLIAEHTLGETALRVFTELAPSGHPTRVAMQNSLAYHLKTQQHDSDGLVSWLWEITGSRDPLAPLVPYLSLCLEHQPERAKALAVRVALINPDEAISVCSSLAQLEEPIKEMFKTELYRQLMRIGQIKLWASCKVSLS